MTRRRLLTPFQERLAERLHGRQATSTVPDNAIWAGVAVVLAPDPDAVLLIRRAERSGDPWSGQMGLPGGQLDPADPDLTATAIRETREEVGLTLTRAQLLGQLDDVSPRTPMPRPVVARPFVFAIADRPPLRFSDEVALAIWVELVELGREGVHREAMVRVRGEDRSFPAYHLGPHLVWGLTERVLTPFLQLVDPR